MTGNNTRDFKSVTPLFRINTGDGEVVIGFSDEETGHDLKKTILSLILQSYEDRVIKGTGGTGAAVWNS